MKKLLNLEKKQKMLINHLLLSGDKHYCIKINNDLSPIGWHVIHCLYIECIWIRSYFLNDTYLLNKLKPIADSINIKTKERGLNLPNYTCLLKNCKNEFKKNILFLKKLNIKKNKKNLFYFLDFLISHHSQS